MEAAVKHTGTDVVDKYWNILRNFTKKEKLTLISKLTDSVLEEEQDEDDDVEIDLHFPTPQTPEEAYKELQEIEAEMRAGQCVTLDEFIDHSKKRIAEYEDCLV